MCRFLDFALPAPSLQRGFTWGNNKKTALLLVHSREIFYGDFLVVGNAYMRSLLSLREPRRMRRRGNLKNQSQSAHPQTRSFFDEAPMRFPRNPCGRYLARSKAVVAERSVDSANSKACTAEDGAEVRASHFLLDGYCRTALWGRT